MIGWDDRAAAICSRLVGQTEKAGLQKIVAYSADASAPVNLNDSRVGVAKSVSHLVDGVDLVLLCLPTSGDVAKVARAHDGLLDCVRQGQIVIDHSWSSLDLTRQLAKAFASRGAAFLDAPIGRSGKVAQSIGIGGLALAIGGDAPAVNAALPTLSCLAKDITHAGSAGAGQITRQMGDLVALQTFTALIEALSTARAFDIDGSRLIDALAKGQRDSVGIGRHGLAAFLGGDEKAGDDRPSIAEASRRLSEIIQLAESRNLTLAGAHSTLTLFEQAIAQGLGEHDLSHLLRMLEPAPRENQRASSRHS